MSYTFSSASLWLTAGRLQYLAFFVLFSLPTSGLSLSNDTLTPAYRSHICPAQTPYPIYAFLVVAASWKGLIKANLIPNPSLIMPSVIKIFPIHMCVQLQTVLPGFFVDNPTLRFRCRFLKRLVNEPQEGLE